MLRHGEVLGDRYRIEGVLGRGATSTVYAANQVALGRRVAIKVLDRVDDRSNNAAERFRREGRLQATLDHPAILPILDAGSTSEGPYLVTKLVEGPTLATLIRDGGVAPARALRMLARIADALDHAHDRGLVHRDVKPSNVLVGEGDDVFLSDFGLARSREGSALTRTGAVVGTVAYIAPEVVTGEEATPASDRYGFAVMLHECLTGDVPFPADLDVASLYAHAKTEPPRLSWHRPDLARADRVLLAGLAKAPERRPARASELVRSVVHALGPTALDGLPAAAPSADGARPSRPRRPSRRRSHRLATGATVVLVAAGSLVLGLRDGATGALVVPPVPANVVALGAELTSTDVMALDCSGEAPDRNSGSCTLSQRRLPDQQTVVPADGTIVGWHVRGATGRVGLQVIREAPGGWYLAYRTAFRDVDGGLRTFTDEVTVRAGDRVALALAPRSGAGLVAVEGDVASDRWIDALSHRPASDLRLATPNDGTPLDGELQLRVDMVPGRPHSQPFDFQGSVARSAPIGEVLRNRYIVLDGVVHELVLARSESVDLLLRRDDETVAATFMPWLPSTGSLDDFRYVDTAGGPLLSIDWRDVRSGRLIHTEFLVSPTGFDHVS